MAYSQKALSALDVIFQAGMRQQFFDKMSWPQIARYLNVPQGSTQYRSLRVQDRARDHKNTGQLFDANPNTPLTLARTDYGKIVTEEFIARIDQEMGVLGRINPFERAQNLVNVGPLTLMQMVRDFDVQRNDLIRDTVIAGVPADQNYEVSDDITFAEFNKVNSNDSHDLAEGFYKAMSVVYDDETEKYRNAGYGITLMCSPKFKTMMKDWAVLELTSMYGNTIEQAFNQGVFPGFAGMRILTDHNIQWTVAAHDANAELAQAFLVIDGLTVEWASQMVSYQSPVYTFQDFDEYMRLLFLYKISVPDGKASWKFHYKAATA